MSVQPAEDCVVTYGEWERDPDVAPILRLVYDGTPVLQHAYRRKVFETWRDDGGRKWGRWDWERRP